MQQTATMWPELGSVAVITIEAFPQWKYTSCTHLSFCIAAAMATNCEEDEGGYIDRRPGGHLRGGGAVLLLLSWESSFLWLALGAIGCRFVVRTTKDRGKPSWKERGARTVTLSHFWELVACGAYTTSKLHGRLERKILQNLCA